MRYALGAYNTTKPTETLIFHILHSKKAMRDTKSFEIID